jgi:hypothetical protein
MTKKEIENVEVIDLSGAYVHYVSFLRLQETLRKAVKVIEYSRMHTTNNEVEKFLDEWNKE